MGKNKRYALECSKQFCGDPIDFYTIEELRELVNRSEVGTRLWAKRNAIRRYRVALGVVIYDSSDVIDVLVKNSIVNDDNISFDVIASALNKTITKLKSILHRKHILSYDDVHANKRYCKRKDLIKNNIIVSL